MLVLLLRLEPLLLFTLESSLTIAASLPFVPKAGITIRLNVGVTV